MATTFNDPIPASIENAQTVRPLGGTATDRAFYTTNLPWETAGADVSTAKTSAEAIKLAGLDWEVELRDMFTLSPSGEYIRAGKTAGIVRDDNNEVLGVSLGSYTPLQNRDMFAWTDALVAEGQARYVGAGSFRGGKVVWLQMQMAEDMKVAGEDYKPYLLATNGHDLFNAFRAFTTMVRVWCLNTYHQALSTQGASGVRVHHHSQMGKRLTEAQKNLALQAETERAMADWMEGAALKKLSDKKVDALIEKLLGVDMKAETIPTIKARRLEDFRTVLGAERDRMGELTGYTFFNAVTGFADHMMKTQGKDNPELQAERRMASIVQGQAQALKARAVKLIDATDGTRSRTR